jgi:hypothetical protein
MTHTIRIEDDVYEGLKRLADPFEDNPNSVIKRLLEKVGALNPRKNPPAEISSTGANTIRKRKGILTPQSVYEDWLLYALWHSFSGKADKREVTKVVIHEMQKYNLLSKPDFEAVSTGESRAENTIAWGRNHLKEEGYISRDTPTGVWELTPDGIAKARELDPPKKK